MSLPKKIGFYVWVWSCSWPCNILLLDLIRVTLLFFSLGQVAVDLLSFWSSFFPVSLIVSSSSSTNPRGEGARPSAVHHSQRFHWSTQKFSIPSKFESSSSFSFIYWFIFTVTGSTNLPLVLLGFGLNLKKSFLFYQCDYEFVCNLNWGSLQQHSEQSKWYY